ncbi:MAG: tetratricopeptide repeat protein, partial [Aquincola sp.]|nr:tetratricopeptide repeat protein [Aquincola sp.]
GLPVDAERLLRQVLASAPTNTDALANLASALQAQGRHTEARALVAQLAALEPDPPLRALYAAKLERLGRRADTPANLPLSR